LPARRFWKRIMDHTQLKVRDFIKSHLQEVIKRQTCPYGVPFREHILRSSPEQQMLRSGYIANSIRTLQRRVWYRNAWCIGLLGLISWALIHSHARQDGSSIPLVMIGVLIGSSLIRGIADRAKLKTLVNLYLQFELNDNDEIQEFQV
jgi:hypothetical protein